MSARGIAIKRPTKPRGRRGNARELRVMMVVDKFGIVVFVQNKAEAAQKAKEAREAQK